MNILTFSTLYPNAAMPNFGVFVENRLRHLVASGAVRARVLAPVPWFPLKSPLFGARAAFARAPRAETRHGLALSHPRYLVIPKLGWGLTPHMLYRAALSEARRLIAGGYDFDLIDAHYFYPDGVAAVWLAHALGKPVTVTARGTDINFIPRYPKARAKILAAGRAASAMIAVSQALKDEMVRIGLPEDRITVLRNGVDLTLFSPRERGAARARHGLARPTLLSVGALIDRKGHDLVISALPDLPDMDLLIAGAGPEEGALKALARALGIDERVRFLGAVPHGELPTLYSAADIMVLASSREGWANVLLEAMACGTPVVASNVWGAPECVARPEAGRLMAERTPAGIVEAVRDLRANPPSRQETRLYAEGFGWEETTQGQIALFRSLLG
ncbi:MAG: glycosyltransferase family 4 protein [Pseudomonadota bacterium]